MCNTDANTSAHTAADTDTITNTPTDIPTPRMQQVCAGNPVGPELSPNSSPAPMRGTGPADVLRHHGYGGQGGLREGGLLLRANRPPLVLADGPDPPAVDPRPHGLDPESGSGGNKWMVHGLR